jgi:hypothetical protein
MSGFPNRPTLRSTLFEAAADLATESEVEAIVDAALAAYDNDIEPPMIGFRYSKDDLPEDDDCPICLAMNAEYEPARLIPLPDGTVLEIRRHRSATTPLSC